MIELKIYPSILSADFSNLAIQLNEIENVGFPGIHVDMMDGQFVSPITFGSQIITAVRKNFNGLLDVHMMVVSPTRFFKEFAEIGVDSISVHLEAMDDPLSDLKLIRSFGLNASLAIKPSTIIDETYPFLDFVDQVLVMSVEPGYGGQSFIPSTLRKISTLREKIVREKYPVQIQVDGGINVDTIRGVFNSGADTVVVGSAVFNEGLSISKAFQDLKNSLTEIT